MIGDFPAGVLIAFVTALIRMFRVVEQLSVRAADRQFEFDFGIIERPDPAGDQQQGTRLQDLPAQFRIGDGIERDCIELIRAEMIIGNGFACMCLARTRGGDW